MGEGKDTTTQYTWLLNNKKMEEEEFIQEFRKRIKEEEEYKKELEKPFNITRDGKYLVARINNEPWIFDKINFEEIVPNLMSGKIIARDGYLYFEGMRIHSWIKYKERIVLKEKLNCDIDDIHVHHINKAKWDNRLNNLEVLQKDEHAKRHGFDTWRELQEDRKKKGLSADID